MSNFIPPSLDEYIDVVECGKDGQLFVATSSLNKRSWTGDLWWFSSAEDAPKKELARTGYRMDSGIVKLKYLGNNQVLLGYDSGGIQVFNCNTTSHEAKESPLYFFELLPSYCEHDDRLTDFDTWSPEAKGENHVVTVGMDDRAVVWDKNFVILHNFSPAHPSGIVAVSCHPTDKNKFATAGLDGSIKVWDTAESKPCSTVYSDSSVPPSTISWNPSVTNSLLVATKTGSVFSLDTSTKTMSSVLSVGDRQIKTLRWSPDRPDLCGVGADDVTVSVIKVEGDNITVHHTDSSHRDFVHALAWNPVTGVLVSGGWDQQVLTHKIP